MVQPNQHRHFYLILSLRALLIKMSFTQSWFNNMQHHKPFTVYSIQLICSPHWSPVGWNGGRSCFWWRFPERVRVHTQKPSTRSWEATGPTAQSQGLCGNRCQSRTLWSESEFIAFDFFMFSMHGMNGTCLHTNAGFTVSGQKNTLKTHTKSSCCLSPSEYNQNTFQSSLTFTHKMTPSSLH